MKVTKANCTAIREILRRGGKLEVFRSGWVQLLFNNESRAVDGRSLRAFVNTRNHHLRDVWWRDFPHKRVFEYQKPL
jgi:hypothetical protein